MLETITPINIAQNAMPTGFTPNAFSTGAPIAQLNNQPNISPQPATSISIIAICMYFLVGLLFSFPGFVLMFIFVIVKKKPNKNGCSWLH